MCHCTHHNQRTFFPTQSWVFTGIAKILIVIESLAAEINTSNKTKAMKLDFDDFQHTFEKHSDEGRPLDLQLLRTWTNPIRPPSNPCELMCVRERECVFWSETSKANFPQNPSHIARLPCDCTKLISSNVKEALADKGERKKLSYHSSCIGCTFAYQYNPLTNT